VHLFDSRCMPVAGSCEYVNEPSGLRRRRGASWPGEQLLAGQNGLLSYETVVTITTKLGHTNY
jgi:hypothetical protein